MDCDWGPWIEHDGNDCPVVGQIVHLVMREPYEEDHVDASYGEETIEVINDCECIDVATNNGSWTWEPYWWPIVRYRVRKPAAMKLLEVILENLPEEEDVWSVSVG